MLSRGELPQQLELLLSHPRIRKAGRLVHSDLARLQKSCNRQLGSFVGALDLARLAKERYVVTNITSTGLDDLAAIVLQKRLNKNTSLRTSQSWENQTLSTEQISYAAIDAAISLILYHQLVNHYMIPAPVLTTSPPSTPVLLYTSNLRSVIAEGCISHHSTSDGVHISDEHVVIDIHHVLIPGAIIISHHHQSLESFGHPPFTLVCLRDHIRIYSPSQNKSHMDLNAADHESLLNNPPVIQEPGILNVNEENEMMSIAESMSMDLSGPEELHPSLTDNINEPQIISESDLAFAERKLGSEEQFGRLSDPLKWDNETHSRVLKDVWHIFHMIYLSTTHGLRKQFTRELRDAFFIPDVADRERIDIWGLAQDPPTTYQKLRDSSPEWTRTRCRHTIPPPHILYPLIRKVFLTYGPIQDRKSKQRLFSGDNQWHAAKNILDLIRKGFVSDPPGISLYTQIGVDKKAGGLPIYRCARGTNATEGGVHTHIRSRLPKFGVSIRHVQASLLDFTLRHNLLVCLFEKITSTNLLILSILGWNI
jgi:hypothetical protein